MQPYNSYFPTSYQPVMNPYQQQQYQVPVYPQQQQIQPVQQTQSQQTSQPQIQNGGFVFVQNENEARMYPIAPGNSITFKDENAPYCYVKTMGFSQLDRPMFKKYRLVEEEDTAQSFQNVQNVPTNNQAQQVIPEYALKEDINILSTAYESIKNDLNTLRDEFKNIMGENTKGPSKQKESEEK